MKIEVNWTTQKNGKYCYTKANVSINENVRSNTRESERVHKKYKSMKQPHYFLNTSSERNWFGFDTRVEKREG